MSRAWMGVQGMSMQLGPAYSYQEVEDWDKHTTQRHRFECILIHVHGPLSQTLVGRL